MAACHTHAELHRLFRAMTNPETLFVPAWFAKDRLDALRAAGFRPVRRQCATSGLRLKAYSISLARANAPVTEARLGAVVTALFGPQRTRRPLVITTCVRMARTFPLVLPGDVGVDIYDARPVDDGLPGFEQRQKALEAYHPYLEKLAGVSGLRVRLHLRNGLLQTAPPFPHKDGEIHLLVNVSPPGHYGIRNTAYAFGTRISAKKENVWCTEATPGRGRILFDGVGHPAVQVLDNTWYLLVPILTHFHGTHSVSIFRQMLALAWNDRCEQKPKRKASARRRRQDVQAMIEGWFADGPKLMAKNILDAEKTIADLQQQLSAAYGKMTVLRETQRAMTEGRANQAVLDRIPSDLLRLSKDPEIGRIEAVDDGINMSYDEIVIESGGHRYVTGPFTVRLMRDNTILLWNDAPTHYDGLPHPHVTKQGWPCYGNASNAILRAAGEFRTPDLMRYLHQWLTRSYSPTHALHKIEEWPRVGETPTQYLVRLIEMGLVPHQPVENDDTAVSAILARRKEKDAWERIKLLTSKDES